MDKGLSLSTALPKVHVLSLSKDGPEISILPEIMPSVAMIVFTATVACVHYACVPALLRVCACLTILVIRTHQYCCIVNSFTLIHNVAREEVPVLLTQCAWMQLLAQQNAEVDG